MNWHEETQCSAFSGYRLVGSGPLRKVASLCKEILDQQADTPLLILSNEDSSQIEIDFRGSEAEVLGRLDPAPEHEAEALASEIAAPVKAGRPRLGVVAREVTLLPRHWEWLKLQPGGASVALRKLVEAARRANADEDAQRKAQGNAYRFMSIMAGALVGFEEASRALFAGNADGFERETESWPEDIRAHARRLAQPVLAIK